jgi:hypothetical protein
MGIQSTPAIDAQAGRIYVSYRTTDLGGGKNGNPVQHVAAIALSTGDVVLDHEIRPWLSYFYLAYGIGTDSAEMPFVGTDLGVAFDAALVLQPGMCSC